MASNANAGNNAPPPSEEAAGLRRALPAYKGHTTRRLNAARSQIEAVEANPVRRRIEQLDQALAKLEEASETYMSKLLELQVVDPPRFAEYEAALESLQTDVMEARSRGVDVSSQAEAGNRAAPEGEPGPGPARDGASRGGKMSEALRPFQLSLDHRPIELRTWVNRFEAYYRSCSMQAFSISEQQEHFMVLLSPQLETAIRNEVRPSTPIFGDGASCMAALEKEFQDRYPVFERRLQLFRDRPSKGQSLSQWWGDFRRASDEARLASLSVDQLMVFFAIGAAEGSIREALLKEKNLTVAIVTRIIKDEEAKAIANAALASGAQSHSANEQAAAAATSAYKRGKDKKKADRFADKNRDRQRPTSPQRSKGNPQKRLTCSVCGSRFHLRAKCPDRKRRSPRANQVEEGSSCTSDDCTTESDSDESDDTVAASAIETIVSTVYSENSPTPRIQVQVSSDGEQ